MIVWSDCSNCVECGHVRAQNFVSWNDKINEQSDVGERLQRSAVALIKRDEANSKLFSDENF